MIDPIILAIETATSACSVALAHDNKTYSKSEYGSTVHSRVLLAMIDAILDEAGIAIADVDIIAADQGPGSFTGLRIGIGVAQGLSFAIQKPMVAVTSLDILAAQYVNKHPTAEGELIVALDARMSEVYWSRYQINQGAWTSIAAILVNKPEALLDLKPDVAIGNAWQQYEGQLTAEFLQGLQIDVTITEPHAQAMLTVAQQYYQKGLTLSASDFVPLYVRDDVAKKSSKALF